MACMYFELLDLLPNSYISTSIINCWASMLNYEESKRNDPTICRLFGHTDLFPDHMLRGQKYNDPKTLEHFKEKLYDVVGKKKEKMNLAEYTIVIFPIFENKHFYLICYDLKNLDCSVIDNMWVDQTVAEEATQLKVKIIFDKYLEEVNHPKRIQIQQVFPRRLNLSWAVRGNKVDCGVYAIRHMETYMGVTSDKWHCGFPNEPRKIKGKLNLLRKKYAAALLLSKTNINRDKILEAANELKKKKKKLNEEDKMERKKKEEMQQRTSKIRETPRKKKQEIKRRMSPRKRIHMSTVKKALQKTKKKQ
ncbi:putative Ulp1 protease family catalytic domain, papain-like cysteine peptidase superfamily [Helianthus annuus]|uniref:Ulp1 protease family catalytic domain, papain-like cysteine peptidase superfamily n=1 Tax=Helianthus annuus TaxID=4232 RepID=A0A9K3JNC9_HELAN|nr:putative Ulp1 protease family catalytic domain, papain-like cysteine peptidase superfamily [Helianthus annuus]KAJ0482959.1 putative Ulp1 protease family catalytic domain, papain-like cysteine peptidase superfamily [Helianthus annuus]KAJ0586198.1 putative Ulp1 protease family catalytic domain, papain-like cysteine peptidase superfamily [Helianthus annuus]KAJ0604982.1 putative Ulp1 protease family catalytic domain, papain-like cysteine peptidase superfamily [Helianthus annuus]KAJ0618996.1 puta